MSKAMSLEQAIKEEKEFRECNYCIDHLMDECGKGPNGQCSLAGTEYCDWECPF